VADTIEDRDPDALADEFEKWLSQNGSKGLLKLETEDEAVLVAHRLSKRGWKAALDDAIVLIEKDKPLGKRRLHGTHVVRVTGKRKEKARG